MSRCGEGGCWAAEQGRAGAAAEKGVPCRRYSRGAMATKQTEPAHDDRSSMAAATGHGATNGGEAGPDPEETVVGLDGDLSLILIHSKCR
ncbi:hypothetical protein BRADI_3g10105v3 [Brachypodium distachyon]|uniref:Uncharacterized protein n=1 Tax=Brachypodium distachyon TaxID=15368 RepID=A0A2K2CWC5_BRADI|nr:hypothetical protein BRADI_3g10105v3 [Brachypodium distachyon]